MSLEISLCMIVRDEEQDLGRCLASAADLVSEIVVVDTGSTDRSREIARSFGARVMDVPWERDFSKARNAGLAQARMPWILVLDADEMLCPPDPHYLRKLLENKKVYGYFVEIRHHIGDGTTGEYVTDHACRLFRNHPGIRFRGKIHEEVVTSIRELPGAQTEFSGLRILHRGYLDAVIEKKGKNQRNLAILREALQQNPEDPMLWYALGTEFFQRCEYRNALAAFERALPRIPVFAGYASDLVVKAAFSMREVGRRRDAETLLRQALTFYPDFVDLLELQAVLHLDEDRPDLALPLLLKGLEIGPSGPKYTSASGSGTYRTHYLAGVCCEHLWLWEEAVRHYRRAIEIQPAYEPAWRRIPELAFLLGREEEILALARACRESLSGALRTRLLSYACRQWPRAWRLAFAGALEVRLGADEMPPAFTSPYRLLEAPRETKVRLARLYESQVQEPGYRELLVAGWLNLETGREADAAAWFAEAGRRRPRRVAPAVGRALAETTFAQRRHPALAPLLDPDGPRALRNRHLLLAAAVDPPF
ncbi:MAG: glycosyltransferase [Alicyclobacillaceae bacterium]|nr:glycosyltransferase [Alicyclobacillaceae bacterium]